MSILDFGFAGRSLPSTMRCATGAVGGTGPVPAGTLQREDRRLEHGAAIPRYIAHLSPLLMWIVSSPTGSGEACPLGQVGDIRGWTHFIHSDNLLEGRV